MNKQRTIDIRYLRMARIWSENSYAIRRKVGALVVKNNMIISDGYNGTPSGFENVCEFISDNTLDKDNNVSDVSKRKYLTYKQNHDGIKLVTKPYVLHAEANAISKLAKSNNSSEGSTLYITDSPCLECSKLIIQSGIVRVVYERQYRITDGIDLLKRANIEVVNISTDEINNSKRQ